MSTEYGHVIVGVLLMLQQNGRERVFAGVFVQRSCRVPAKSLTVDCPAID